MLFNNGTQFFYIEIGMVDGKLSMIHSWKEICQGGFLGSVNSFSHFGLQAMG